MQPHAPHYYALPFNAFEALGPPKADQRVFISQSTWFNWNLVSIHDYVHDYSLNFPLVSASFRFTKILRN